MQEAAKAPATVRLLTYYQSNGLGLPRYQYFNLGNLIRSQITLSNGEFVVGKPARTREEASENVAARVLNIFLKGTKTKTKPVQAETRDQPSNSQVRLVSISTFFEFVVIIMSFFRMLQVRLGL